MPHEYSGPSTSVAATGLGIRYIGEHVYALSGQTPAHTDPQIVLSFTTGSGYIVGEFQLNGAVNPTNPVAGLSSLVNIIFNDERIAIIKSETSSQEMPSSVTQKVIIPPFTKVEAITDSDDIQANRYTTVTLVGRVYGAE